MAKKTYYVVRKDVYKTLIPVQADNMHQALGLVERGKISDHACLSLWDEKAPIEVHIASKDEQGYIECDGSPLLAMP